MTRRHCCFSAFWGNRVRLAAVVPLILKAKKPGSACANVMHRAYLKRQGYWGTNRRMFRLKYKMFVAASAFPRSRAYWLCSEIASNRSQIDGKAHCEVPAPKAKSNKECDVCHLCCPNSSVDGAQSSDGVPCSVHGSSAAIFPVFGPSTSSCNPLTFIVSPFCSPSGWWACRSIPSDST